MATAASENEEADSLYTNLMAEMLNSKAESAWDPNRSRDWDKEKPTEQCFLRIKRSVQPLPPSLISELN